MTLVTHDGAPAPARRRQSGTVPQHGVYAALDLGTNNCRLLVARPVEGGFRVVDSFSRIVRLGEGLATNGRLSEPAIARTMEALRICAHKMAQRGVTHGRHVATEACRRAANGAAFLAAVAEQTGIALEVIDSEEEARLALAGCASLLHRKARYGLVLDIGGGSTELIWLEVPGRGAPVMRDYLSLPFGVVNFSESYGGDRIGAETYEAMATRVADAVAPLDARHGIAAAVARGEVQMVGTSGTVTTLAAVLLDLDRYRRDRVDGCTLTFERIGAASRRLAGMDAAGRAAHPCIGPERADLVVAGAAILEGIFRRWPVGRLRVADRGLREGILLGLMAGAD